MYRPFRVLVVALVSVLVTFSVSFAQPRGTAARPSPAARPFKVVIVIGSTGPADAPIVDAVLDGIALAAKKGRIAHAMRLAVQPKDYASVLDDLAKESVDLVVAAGTFSLEALSDAARQHPATRILLVDAALSGAANVKSVTFLPEEGAFLAGVVAAVETRRGRVGFVGGEETSGQPVECGWETGVRWATKERYLAVHGRAIYIGTTPAALVNPAAAEELSRGLIAGQGVDVLYSAAGASGHGVISAARDEKVKVIGVDVDQRELAPNAVITSVRKRVDRTVETAIADVRRGTFEGGVTVMNLANGGVDLVLPGRLAAPTVKLVEKARAGLVSGRIPACVKEEDRVPEWNFPPRPEG